MPDDRRLVYSTDGTLPLPSAPKRARAKQPAHAPPDDGVLRVGCERRRGGSVTIVYGIDATDLASVGAELRKRCGTGGTAKDGVVTLQGDKRGEVIAYFSDRGKRAKRMGG